MDNCIFCNINSSEIIAENKFVFAVLDKFPVNEGHALIITKRHFESFFDASEEEIVAIYSLMHELKEMFDVQYEPAGYNVGINIGYAAGQTIMHLHLHFIPRYNGDVENPRGGIRKLKMNLVDYDG